MNISDYLRDLNQKLSKFELNRDSLESLRQKINDPIFWKNQKLSAFKRLSTRKGIQTIVWGISIATISISLPIQVSSLLSAKSEYESSALKVAEIPDLDIQLKNEANTNSLLREKESRVDSYLSNSARILLLPELISTAAISNRLTLLSFKPYQAQEEFGAEYTQDQSFQPDASTETDPPPVSDEIPPVSDEVPPVDDLLSLNQDSVPQPTQPLKSLEFILQVRGDYLQCINFLRDIQSYNSFISIQRANYTDTSSQSSPDGATASQSTGDVQLELVLRVPLAS